MVKKKEIVPIDYTSREFTSIRKDLEEYARVYYPDTVKDFSDAGFASLMLDTVSYVGDMLSFYLDYNVNESFMSTAIEYGNVLKHAEQMGYKIPGPGAAFGQIALYILAPAAGAGLGPDAAYCPVLRRGSRFTSDSGATYVLIDDVDFADPNNEVVVAESVDGAASRYAIKTYGQIMSGELEQVILDVGEFEKFLRLEVPIDNITEIISVFDSEGHPYFEVDYLTQNIVYRSIPTTGDDRFMAPNILKAQSVPRRYVIERDSAGTTYMRFGYGSDSELRSNPIVHPSNLVLKRHGRSYETLNYLDPSKILETDKFGIVPTNTSLTILVRRNTLNTVNSGVGTVTGISEAIYRFPQDASSGTKKSLVRSSLETINEQPITGDVAIPNSSELKRRAKDFFAAQNRAVTKNDYVSLLYAMPSRFGAIKRCNLTHDNDSFKRNLNLYILSEGADGKLINTNSTIKNNLKTWLSQYKMINDTIDILDGKIVNFGIDFVAVSETGTNKYDVFNNIIINLREFMINSYDMGEPLAITRIYDVINDTLGVVDVVSVKIRNLTGNPYSSVSFDMDHHISPDGRFIDVPEDIIMELKYPLKDIKGTVR
jgi:hypothetical protein